jgi:hypothetical protein
MRTWWGNPTRFMVLVCRVFGNHRCKAWDSQQGVFRCTCGERVRAWRQRMPWDFLDPS